MLAAPGRRDALLAHLAAAGIGARAVWRPLHQQPPYAAAPRLGGAVAIELFERGFSLPSSFALTADDQQRVVGAVRSFAG